MSCSQSPRAAVPNDHLNCIMYPPQLVVWLRKYSSCSLQKSGFTLVSVCHRFHKSAQAEKTLIAFTDLTYKYLSFLQARIFINNYKFESACDTNDMFYCGVHSFGNASVFFGASFRVTSAPEFQDYDNHS